MPYYFIDLMGEDMSIGPLKNKKNAVIECEDRSFNNIIVHRADYKEVKDSCNWGGSCTWKIIEEFENLPNPHRFNVGDKVTLKKNINPERGVSHVLDNLRPDKIYQVNPLHYYSGWGYGKVYSVVGVENGYGGWIPEEFFELYEEKPTDIPVSDEFPGRIVDDSPFQVGEYVWMHNYLGSGIPFSSERIEQVIIFPNSNSRAADCSHTWTHTVKWKGRFIRLDNSRAKFSYLHPREITSTIPEQYADCGSYILACNDGGNGLPKELTSVKIVNPRYVKESIRGLLPTSKWNHIVEYKGEYYRINTHTAIGGVNPCKEVPLSEPYPDIDGSAVKVGINNMYGSTGTIASTGTTVISAAKGTAFNCIIAYPITPSEAYRESQSKIKSLKQQKPIILKTKNHGNERRIKLRNNCVS